MPTVIPRQYGEQVPMWLETLINNISLSPMTSALPVGEAVTQGALPFSKTALAALKKWKSKPLAQVPEQTLQLTPPRATLDGATQGALDFGGPSQPGLFDEMTNMLSQTGAKMSGMADDTMQGLKGLLGQGAPEGAMVKASPQGMMPMGGMKSAGAGRTAAAAAPPMTGASPAAQAAAGGMRGLLSKVGRGIKNNPIKAGLGAAGIGALGYDLSDGVLFDGSGATPPPVTTNGGGRGRGSIVSPQAPQDFAGLDSMLASLGQGAPQVQAPSQDIGALLGAVDPKTAQASKGGFDWTQMLQMLPALMVAIAMMKRGK